MTIAFFNPQLFQTFTVFRVPFPKVVYFFSCFRVSMMNFTMMNIKSSFITNLTTSSVSVYVHNNRVLALPRNKLSIISFVRVHQILTRYQCKRSHTRTPSTTPKQEVKVTLRPSPIFTRIHCYSSLTIITMLCFNFLIFLIGNIKTIRAL